MTTRTITAMFDGRAEAERAVEALVSEAGIDRGAVRMDAAEPGSGAAAAAAAAAEDKGFLASLRDLFVPDEDRHAYAEGLRRGSVLVSAQVDDARVERVMDVLERHGAVDLDEREAEWRRGGWTGEGATGAGAAAAAGTAGVVGAVSDGTRTGVAAMPGATGVDAGAKGQARPAAAPGVAEGEEAIPIVEERLTVGKREMDRGRVRVRSYVVETPVQEQVTLREERVDVERRAVDRPVADADRLFEERTIEATESAEEAVVAKEARVTEEVVVRTGAEERVQTVRDTVRRTQVEVEDDRRATADRTAPAAPETPPQRRDRG